MKTNFEAICKQELTNLKRKKQGRKQQHFEDVIEQLFTYPKPQINDDLDELDLDTLNLNFIRKRGLDAQNKLNMRKYSQDNDLHSRNVGNIEHLGKRAHRKGSTLEDILDKPQKVRKRKKNTNKITLNGKKIRMDDSTTVGTLSDLNLSRNTSKCSSTIKGNSLSGSVMLNKGNKSVITSHSFKSRTYSQKWTIGETKLFFRALGLFGTDFSMITLMFQGRTRSQIINKFHKEEKEHPDLIEKALMSHKKCDSKLLTRYNEFLQNAQQQAKESQDLKNKSSTGVRRKRCESMDSTDQTIYEELSKCITKGIRELSDRSLQCV